MGYRKGVYDFIVGAKISKASLGKISCPYFVIYSSRVLSFTSRFLLSWSLREAAAVGIYIYYIHVAGRFVRYIPSLGQ
jgi:hypothetical protein